MTAKNTALPETSVTGRAYQIKVQGQLEAYWSDWLGGLEISQDAEGHSVLTGTISDQAALHGILTQIRDLGLPLISITSRTSEEEE